MSLRVTFTLHGAVNGAVSILPVALLVVPWGMAFGVAAVAQGIAPAAAIMTSFLVFSGTAQFAVLEAIASGTVPAAILLSVAALNARHTIMGATLAPALFRLPLSKRLLALTFLSDVNYADARRAIAEGDSDIGRLFGGGLVLWLGWTVGTAAGAVGGDVIGDPARLGLDVVLLGFLVAATTGQARQKPLRVPICTTVAMAWVLHGQLPPGWDILCAALAGTITSVFAGWQDVDN